MKERLQKILSQWGIASRRQAEQMILAGRVKLNGQIAQLGQSACTESDRIEVDGQLVQPTDRPQLVYLLLHKPAGVVSTCTDPQGRPTVLDLLPPELRQSQGIHPVGRLDFESTGALILTNDGDLTFRLTHPKHGIPKTYEVWVRGCPPPSVLAAWRHGVSLEGRNTLPAGVRVLKRVGEEKTLLEITISEGRNRQIRRVADKLGYPVIQLHRCAIGPLRLTRPAMALPKGAPDRALELPCGNIRHLTSEEIHFLQSPINLIFDSRDATRE
ncbi:MAG TPA: rRNA pseudouridine synthase [Oscillatoriaceae cyanobacterium M33_DOE_052]|uniref:Pseudouridine synthase n=1 Tax=Planktothricoides sp. SpSt-374 TaxID=2282167 RepID=A0A7C3VJU9_9CYAN|nr:rRNA pseudouridine synthase [Oscillatoriaceae cyanobacterium M33_DOE_052]